MAGILNNNTGKVEYTCDGCGRYLGISSNTPYKGNGNHYCSLGCQRNIERIDEEREERETRSFWENQRREDEREEREYQMQSMYNIRPANPYIKSRKSGRWKWVVLIAFLLLIYFFS